MRKMTEQDFQEAIKELRDDIFHIAEIASRNGLTDEQIVRELRQISDEVRLPKSGKLEVVK